MAEIKNRNGEPVSQTVLSRLAELQRLGWTVLHHDVSANCCDRLTHAVNELTENSILGSRGRVVGSRNLLDHSQIYNEFVSTPSVQRFLRSALGDHCGLVRVLYFDKPPGQGWSLAMHRDCTIAVQSHFDPPNPFSKPTVKAGVPHVEADEATLASMLTLRLHLDPMTTTNGPLHVISGSHVNLDELQGEPIREIHCNRGDIFVMRPLLLHGSRAAEPGTQEHRRVLHFEFAANPSLPSPYQWHRFVPVMNGLTSKA